MKSNSSKHININGKFTERYLENVQKAKSTEQAGIKDFVRQKNFKQTSAKFQNPQQQEIKPSGIKDFTPSAKFDQIRDDFENDTVGFYDTQDIPEHLVTSKKALSISIPALDEGSLERTDTESSSPTSSEISGFSTPRMSESEISSSPKADRAKKTNFDTKIAKLKENSGKTWSEKQVERPQENIEKGY